MGTEDQRCPGLNMSWLHLGFGACRIKGQVQGAGAWQEAQEEEEEDEEEIAWCHSAGTGQVREGQAVLGWQSYGCLWLAAQCERLGARVSVQRGSGAESSALAGVRVCACLCLCLG